MIAYGTNCSRPRGSLVDNRINYTWLARWTLGPDVGAGEFIILDGWARKFALIITASLYSEVNT